MTQRKFAGIAVCMAVSAASAAVAEPASVSDQGFVTAVKVQYQDADTRTPDGVRKILARLRSAAEDVCGGDDLLVRTGARYQACVEETLAKAGAALDAPMLTAAIAGHARLRR